MRTGPGHGTVPNKERGFVLLAVVVAITLVAAIAFALGTQGASQVNMTTGEVQRDRLRYVAEAGLAHAKWQLAQNTSCADYKGVPAAPFGAHSYTAAITPASGSPVSLTATGSLANGTSRTLTRTNVRTYASAVILKLQPGAASGKDTHVYEWKSSWNYGASSDLQVEDRIVGDWSNALLEFDVSLIPATATIINATLELNQWSPTGSVGGDFAIHRVTSPWVEGVLTGGNGSPNWTERDVGIAWTTAGGDYDPEPVATINFSAGVGPQRWELAALVQEWVSKQSPNLGIAIVPATFGSNAIFSSSDASDATLHPKLTIIYACECGKICTSGSGGGKKILLVVGDPANLTPEQADKKALMEGWGHSVTLIATNETQSAFDTAATAVDVVYIPELGAGPMGELDTKADGLTTGVITEEARKALLLGSWSIWPFVNADAINITDNTHYITETLATGNVVLSTAVQSMWVLTGTLAPDLHVLGELNGTDPGLAYLESGEQLNDGNPAPARRVKLPWGSFDFDVTLFTEDARTIMQRAIEWVAGAGGGTPAAGDYLDEFNSLTCDPAIDYIGSDGSLDWATYPWQEDVDGGDSCGNKIQLVNDGDNRLQLAGNSGESISRQVDLNGVTSATLSFDYLQFGPFDTTRYLGIEISDNGGASWNELGRIDTEGDEATYLNWSADVTAYAAADSVIRLVPVDLGATRKIYVDNVRVDVNGGGGGGGGLTDVVFEEFRDASLASNGAAISITKPSGTAAGDLLIAAVVTDGEQKPEMSAPGGWMLIDHGVQSKQVTMDVLWKIAGASEPSSYDFSWVKVEEAYGWIMRFTGHDPAAPIHSSQSAGGASSSPVSPAVLTTIANTLILRIGGFDDDDITADVPGLAGHSAITMGKSDSGTGTTSGGAGYILQHSTGDSGTSTFSLTASEEYRAVTIAIAPAP